jgi:hypothetical protein
MLPLSSAGAQTISAPGAITSRRLSQISIPTPSDEISSAAGRLMASGELFRDRKLIRQFSQIIADAGVTRLVVDGQQPTDDLFADALSNVFGRFLDDAHMLAGFAHAFRSPKPATTNERAGVDPLCARLHVCAD